MKVQTHVISAVAVAVVLAMTTPAPGALTSIEADGFDFQVSGAADYESPSPIGPASVLFPAVSDDVPPTPAYADLLADVGVSSGAFVGDLPAAGVEGICFRIRKSVGGRTQVRFRLVGATGRIWTSMAYRDAGSDGAWVVNNIPLDRAQGGWTRGERGDLDALWAADLRDVQAIGFIMSRAGAEEQSVSIDDLRLIGDGFVSEEAVLSKLRELFGEEISNTDQLSAAQQTQDSDKDGTTDVDALVAGMDPGLAVEIAAVDGEGITIRWPCVQGRTYTIERGEDLTDGLDTDIAGGLVAEESGYMTYRDGTATGPGAYFYKVTKE